MIRSCGCGEDTSKELGSFSKCDVCNVRGTLDIFKEFNEVYKERFKETELAAGDATELKLKTLQDWVADLTEQNTVLVETVDALEKEALYRLEIGMNAQRCAELETKQPGSIKDRLMYSQDGEHDSFKKKNYDNGKLKFLDDHHTHDTLQQKKECKVCRSRRTVGFSHSSDELHNRGVDSQLQETEDKLERAQMEIENLKQNLIDNEQKLEKINEDIIASEKSAREMRAALTAEVADKHDQVLALRRDVQHLEEKLRQADMQTHFKDDIIKELRKEIKVANNKLRYLGLDPAVPSSSKPVKNSPPIQPSTHCTQNKPESVKSFSYAPLYPPEILKLIGSADIKEQYTVLCDNKLNTASNNRIDQSAVDSCIKLKRLPSYENIRLHLNNSEGDHINDEINKSNRISMDKDTISNTDEPHQYTSMSKKIKNDSLETITEEVTNISDSNKNYKNSFVSHESSRSKQASSSSNIPQPDSSKLTENKHVESPLSSGVSNHKEKSLRQTKKLTKNTMVRNPSSDSNNFQYSCGDYVKK